MVQVVHVVQVVQEVQVIQVIQVVSLDDIHSENIWFSGSNSSNYRGKLRCHTCDGRTNGGGKWKIGQYSELNQKPQNVLYDTYTLYITSFKGNETKFAHKLYMLPGNFLSVSLSAR